MSKSSLHLALIHSPVLNRNGDTVSAALTTIDLHDIARAALTYGADGFYVVTPFEDQQALAEKVIDHWVRGAGGTLNPDRKAALALVEVAASFEEVCARIKEREAGGMVNIATSAKDGHENTISVADLSRMLAEGGAYVLNFGTAWGLSGEFIAKCDYVLAPIKGRGAYNHLSVRSAVSIYLDRIVNFQ